MKLLLWEAKVMEEKSDDGTPAESPLWEKAKRELDIDNIQTIQLMQCG